VAPSRPRTAFAFALSIALGFLAGLAGGVACMVLEVGGAGPESGLWVLILPVAGLAEGLFAAAFAHLTIRLRPTPLRIGAVAAATVAASYGLNRLVFAGFELHVVDFVLAGFLGLVVAALWPRWTRATAPRRARAAGDLTPVSETTSP
jgi:hypothetical protein